MTGFRILAVITAFLFCSLPGGGFLRAQTGATQPATRPAINVGEIYKEMRELEQKPHSFENERRIYELQAQIQRELVAPMLKAANERRLELDVMVEDEQGNALDNVALHIVSDTLKRGGWANDSTERTQIINKEGHISAMGAGVTFYLVKEGYYKKIIDFPLVDVEATAKVLVTYGVPVAVGSPPKLRFRLEKQGIRTLLEGRRAELIIKTDGSASIFAWNLPGKARGVEVKNIADNGRLPAHAIFANAPVGVDGLFEGSWRFPNERREPQPVKVAIKMSDPKDGFVKTLVPPQAFATYVHAMRKAPTEGYAQTIEFTIEELRKTIYSTDNGTSAFYFKLDGKYGRGAILLVPKLSADAKVMTLQLGLELQPDGSVNLETGE